MCKLYQKSGIPGIVTKNNCFDNKGSLWREGVHDGAYWGRSKYKYKSSYFVERTCAERNQLQRRKFFAVERYVSLICPARPAKNSETYEKFGTLGRFPAFPPSARPPAADPHPDPQLFGGEQRVRPPNPPPAPGL